MLINGIEVQITRKFVKHLRLGIHPPDGRVRITAPWFVTNTQIKRLLVSKLSWIEEKQAAFRLRPPATVQAFVSGETHYVQGQAHQLKIIDSTSRARVFIEEPATLVMAVPATTSQSEREAILNAWYRCELKKRIAPFIDKWESTMQVQVLEWRIKKMKTRWGTCNAQARRIWLSLELAKKSDACLEYVVVHEMVHFFERHHNDRFKALMDGFLPGWRIDKNALNGSC